MKNENQTDRPMSRYFSNDRLDHFFLARWQADRGDRVTRVFYDRDRPAGGGSARTWIIGVIITQSNGRERVKLGIFYFHEGLGEVRRAFVTSDPFVLEALGNASDIAVDEIERLRSYRPMPEREGRGGRCDA